MSTWQLFNLWLNTSHSVHVKGLFESQSSYKQYDQTYVIYSHIDEASTVSFWHGSVDTNDLQQFSRCTNIFSMTIFMGLIFGHLTGISFTGSDMIS